MKTAYLINSLEGGGAERVFSQLLDMVAHDANQRERIDAILLDIKPEAYRLPESVVVHRVGQASSLLGSVMQFLKLIVLLAKLRPRRVVSFLTRANLYNVLISKLLNFNSVISERSNTSGRLAGSFIKLKRGLVAAIYARADKVIAVSNGVADCLIKDFFIAPEKVFVLTNPVDLEFIRARASDDSSPQFTTLNQPSHAKIMAMGRLVDTKGFEDLLHAYAQSKQHCGLAILGEGPNRSRLADLINELNLGEQVELLGFVKNPYALISRADIFVLSSRLEGFPNALVEAMALGKAVIATDCKDGPREILNLAGSITTAEFEITEFGLMVNVGDREAMAKAIVHLINNDELRAQLSANAQRRVTDFSKQKFYQTYLQVLEAGAQ